ncbi:MAG: hypothetical protein A2W91_18540 [Bacteroidetes bacterium GWF2_38_335]|nr:MAG: hypothetical protein A2W91_18540 [Bacteroidetes bacterium GWF2_38_335]OFY78197.1 MAG: hypothetical protein A2281_04525 [Bacteroidetes bacterium RIFOXYA12_FULL_38_20]HBS88640.1 hypothetical protein [Bacteroidales bacterium]
MKRFKYFLIAASVPMMFSCSGGPDYCECFENSFSENKDAKLDEECEKKFEKLTDEEVMVEIEKCYKEKEKEIEEKK